MVQLYYYESRGRCARKLLRHDGYSGSTPGSSKTRVLLFPYEGWAHPAAATYLLIKTVWWSRTRCKIIEVTGTRRQAATGRMTSASSSGNFYVVGKFHDASVTDADFKLSLSTNVSTADFQLGYCMTGTLERGCHADGRMEMTHYAMIKRKGY